jgi:hypothetical protein
MNIGLFWDSAINVNSYYVKDNTAYRFCDNMPYTTHHHSFSAQCFNSTHNFPFLWGNGCFINISEWNELPELDLDVIFYANERVGLTDENKVKYSTDTLRKKYKKAKIVGYLKEVYVKEGRENNRIEFLKSCDFIHAEATSTMKVLPEFLSVEEKVGKKLNFTNQPFNIKYIFENYYSEVKERKIFAYLPNPIYRRGKTYAFAEYIGKKYNIEVITKPLTVNQKFDHMSQHDFVKMWSKNLFHFNLDPSPIHPGGQCCQVANVGSINVGGLNESHEVLYPSTCGIDLKYLENKFVEILDDSKKQFEIISYAWNMLNATYSFETVKSQILSLYSK